MQSDQIIKAIKEARGHSEPLPTKEPLHGQTSGERVVLVPTEEGEIYSARLLNRCLSSEEVSNRIINVTETLRQAKELLEEWSSIIEHPFPIETEYITDDVIKTIREILEIESKEEREE